MDLTTLNHCGSYHSHYINPFPGVAIHRTNKKSDAIDKLESDVTILQQIAVTDSHVRKIKEELQTTQLIQRRC